MAGFCAGDRGAEALDGWEDLLGDVPVYVWFEGAGGFGDIEGGKGAFRDGSGGVDFGGRRFGVAAWRGQDGDVGDNVVDAHGFAGG